MKRYLVLLFAIPFFVSACATTATGLCEYDVGAPGITADELGDGLYDEWDDDADGLLDEDDFIEGLDTWDLDDEFGATFYEWDTDDDGFIDEDEFDVGFEESGVWSTWDTDGDGLLDSDECMI